MSFSAATTGVGAVVNIILNFILIPKYGGLGAGIATLAAQFVASYVSNAIFPKTRPMFVMQTKALFFWDWIQFGLKKLSPSWNNNQLINGCISIKQKVIILKINNEELYFMKERE